jgi:trimethylamine-N-oxide reductase (cytochrome c)
VSAYAGSAQYRPVGEPGRSTDLGGCVNMLCPSDSITKKGHGIKPNTTLIQVEPWTGVDTWQPAEAT